MWTQRTRRSCHGLAKPSFALLTIVLMACGDGPPGEVTGKTKVAHRGAATKTLGPKRRGPRPPSAADPIVKKSPRQPTVTALAPGEYALEGQLGFIGRTKVAQHPWVFSSWSGRVAMPADGRLRKAKFQIAVDMNSVAPDGIEPTSQTARMRAHLLGIDFFHVAAHPQATFVSSSVTRGSIDGRGTHVVTGKLTLLGTQKEVIIPVNMSFKKGQFKGEGEFTLRRKRFNMLYRGTGDNTVDDKVVIKFKVKST
ncbi:MAG: YceI family protein [Myxococcota bacterium]|nr:YceI family protein [Myxococcota bacterium]